MPGHLRGSPGTRMSAVPWPLPGCTCQPSADNPGAKGAAPPTGWHDPGTGEAAGSAAERTRGLGRGLWAGPAVRGRHPRGQHARAAPVAPHGPAHMPICDTRVTCWGTSSRASLPEAPPGGSWARAPGKLRHQVRRVSPTGDMPSTMCRLLALLFTKYCHTDSLAGLMPCRSASWLISPRMPSFSSSPNSAGTMPGDEDRGFPGPSRRSTGSREESHQRL